MFQWEKNILDESSREYFTNMMLGKDIRKRNINVSTRSQFCKQLEIVFKRFKKYTWNFPIFFEINGPAKYESDSFDNFQKSNFFKPYNLIFFFYKMLFIRA